MERRVFAWQVERVGRTVRVDLTKASEVTDADAEAIAAAVEEILAHPEVEAVKLDGPVLLDEGPPDGLKQAIRTLDVLAKKHGKRFTVGPI